MGRSLNDAVAMRSQQYAAQFGDLNARAIAVVDGCGDDEWPLPSVEAGRSEAVVAYHIAEVQRAFDRMLAALAAGETYTPTVSAEEIDARNALHAVEQAGVGKAETLGLLQTHGAAIAATLHGLDDDTLGRFAGTFGGHEMTVAQVVEWIVIGHTAEHLASIETVLAA